MKRLGRGLILALASCGFLSYLFPRLTSRGRRNTGSGLVGSIAGAATGMALPSSAGAQVLFLLGGLFVSVAIADAAEKWMGEKDDSRIVIDEWIGCLCAVAFLPRTWGTLVGGVILFRIFDVWKKPWIFRLASLPGGWGVVMDDVLAGLYANGILQLGRLLFS